MKNVPKTTIKTRLIPDRFWEVLLIYLLSGSKFDKV